MEPVPRMRPHRRSAIAFLLAAGLLLACAVTWSEPVRGPDPRAEIARRLEVRPEDIRPSPIPGLFEVQHGADIGYVSADGRHYIDGDLFDLQSHDNLTERRRQQARLARLAAFGDEAAIVFAPRGPVRHTVTVFTDIDCTYCRRLHQEMNELNRLGIRVRYLMFPRTGPDTESWHKAEAVWCSADRKDALTRAKRGETIKAGPCQTPIEEHYELGRELGIRGTPGIISDKGEYIAGYLPAAQLARLLAGANANAAGD